MVQSRSPIPNPSTSELTKDPWHVRPLRAISLLGARDTLVQRLLEAMTVLGQLQDQTADLAAVESGITESITEIRAESEARAAAAEEIAALLGGTKERPGDGIG